MADVFDTLEKPATTDVFDEIEIPSGDVFDAVTDSAEAVVPVRKGVWSTGVDIIGKSGPFQYEGPLDQLPQVSAEDAPKVLAEIEAQSAVENEQAKLFQNQVSLEPPAPSAGTAFLGKLTAGVTNAAAGTIDILEDDEDAPIGPTAGDPSKQRRLDVLRQRISDLDKSPGDTSAREYGELVKEARALSRPLREDTFAGKLSRTAANAAAEAEEAPGALGSIARGAGTVASFAPALVLGPGGLAGVGVAGAQAVAEAESVGRTQQADALRAAGVTDEAQIETTAKAAGINEAAHAALAMPAYLLAGKLGAEAASRIMAGASRTATVAAQTIAATTANVVSGAAIRALSGEEAAPNLEQFTGDVLWGIVHGVGVNVSEKAKSRARAELASRGWAQHEIDNPSGVPERFRANEEQPASEISISPDILSRNETPPKTPTEAAPIERRFGPGAANIEEFPAQRQISAYNAAVDAQRAERGLSPLMSEARQADTVTWDKTEQRIEADPEFPARLVEEINSGKKTSVSDVEQSSLLWRIIDLRNRRENELVRWNDENSTPEDRAQAKVDYEAFEEQLQRAEEADRKSGTMQGRALRIRRMLVNEDHTFAGMMGREKIAKGDALTPAETAKIKSESEAFQKADKALEQRERQLEEEAPIDAAIKAIETEARKDPTFTPEVRSLAERISARLERAADSALKRLRAKGFLQLGSAPDPTILADLVIYGTAKLTKGLLDFGRWSASMVRDLGRGVEPHLREVWDASNVRIDEAAAAGGKNKAKVKEAVTKAPAVATADSIGAKMKERSATGEKLTGMRGDIQKLVETLVRGGIKTRGPLLDAVHEVLKSVDPAITRRETSDAISGYGDFKPLNPDTVKAEVRDLKGQLQQVAKIEDILGGKPLQKTGVERRTPSDEERALIKQVNELARQHGVKVTDPATQLKTVLGAMETRLTNRIKDLKAEIAKGSLTIKTRTTPPTNAKIDALRAELAKVEADHEAVFGKREMTDAQRLKAYKTRTQKRIKDLEGRMARGDFAPPPKRPKLDISKDPEAVKAKAEKERVVREFQKRQQAWKLKQRSFTRKGIDFVKDVLGSTRTVITSADLSAPFRQGGVFAIGDLVFNPRRLARQLGQMLRSATSEKGFQEQMAAIRLRPNVDLYESSGLYLADIDGTFTGREENMRSNLAEKIPIAGRVVRGSNRAYAGFLNRQRADAFDAFVQALGGKDKVTPQDAQFIAKGINDLTGRGEASKGWTGSMDAMARFFFSPRFLISRFKTLLGAPVLRGQWRGKDAVSLRARAKMAAPYLKFAGALSILYGLAQLNGADVEKDVRSSDFGKIRMGDTRVDPLAGLAQVSTFMGRFISGETKRGDSEKDQKRSETFLRFARTKLSPLAGIAADFAAEETIDKQEPTALGSVKRLTVPISYGEVQDIYEEHGATKAALLQMLGIFGFGLQNY